MIINELRGGYQVDDNRIDLELVGDKVHDRRNSLLEEYIKANGPDESMYQADCCIEIKCEDIVCEGRVLTSRYVANIKPLLSVAGQTFVRFVGTSDFAEGASELPINAIEHKEGDLWTSGDFRYTFVGADKMLLHNLPTPNMKYLCLVGIFDNPNITCTGYKDKPYPIPGALVSKLVYDVVQMLVKPMLMMNPEQKNNATDDMPQSPNSRR
jgi:hypothetical protein